MPVFLVDNTGKMTSSGQTTNIFNFFTDFEFGVVDSNIWTTGGSLTRLNDTGGAWQFGNANAFIRTQKKGWSTALGRTITFEIRVKFPSAGINPAGSQWGLLDMTSPGAFNNSIYISYNNQANVAFLTAKDGTFTNNVISSTPTHTQYKTYKFIVDGQSSVKGYIDNVLVSTITTNIPTVDLYLWCLSNTNTATVDYIRITSTR